jgi:GAF domain-containing protein
VSSSFPAAYLSYRAWVEGAPWAASLCLLALIALLLSAFLRIPGYWLQGGILLVALHGLAIIAFLHRGSAGPGSVFLLAGLVVATLLFGRLAGLASLLVGAALVAVVPWLWASRIIEPVQERTTGELLRYPWMETTLVLVAVGGALTVTVDRLAAGLRTALAVLRRRCSQLEARDRLLTRESKDLERQNALQSRRIEALHTVLSVALDIAGALEEGELLEQAATLTSERFGFSHVGIFIVEPSGEWAELRAASSEAGQRMLARRHRLRVGEEGLVGSVIDRGEARIAPNVDADAAYYENPDLPETRSEMAVPLRYEGGVIGALDVQETSRHAFRGEDIAAMQALADLIVAALRSVRLSGELRRSVAAERRLRAQLSAQAWLERARAAKGIGYRFDRGEISQLTDLGGEDIRRREDKSMRGERSWPLSVRGRVVGSVQAHKRAQQGDWTLPERELMETVVAQLGAALETARLYEDTQYRAARDRLVADVTGRIRVTLDLDTVLRTAADEVYAALDLEEVVIQLVTDAHGEGSPGER